MDQIIALVSDILLGAGALGAAVYCGVLARRLKRFNNLENGVGGAVALLSAQVDDMTRTLDLARKAAGHSSETLTALTDRAESASRKLELMLAALNDLPDLAPEAMVAGANPPASVGSESRARPATTDDDARELQADAAWVAAVEAAAEPERATPPLFLSRRTGADAGRGAGLTDDPVAFAQTEGSAA